MVVYESSNEGHVSGSSVRIGGWGSTDMRSRERGRRLPWELPQNNSVGELPAALDIAKSFRLSSKVALVRDSAYVRNGFSSVRKWCVNGWFLPSGQQVGHHGMWQEVLQVLDDRGPQLQVLWCPSHEAIPVNERANDLAETGTGTVECELSSEAATTTPNPGNWLIFVPRVGIDTHRCGSREVKDAVCFFFLAKPNLLLPPLGASRLGPSRPVSGTSGFGSRAGISPPPLFLSAGQTADGQCVLDLGGGRRQPSLSL